MFASYLGLAVNLQGVAPGLHDEIEVLLGAHEQEAAAGPSFGGDKPKSLCFVIDVSDSMVDTDEAEVEVGCCG